MSITRKFCKGLGLTDEQAEAVCEEHTIDTDRMKAEIESLKVFEADSKELKKVQKELEEATKKIATLEELQTKYDNEHKAFEDFKKEIETRDTVNKVKEAYKALLKANNVDDKRFDAILKVTDFANVKLNDKGKFDNEKELNEAIKQEWGGFIVTTEDRGKPVDNPPANSGTKKTKEEIMKIKNTTERQKAIADNPELFGIA